MRCRGDLEHVAWFGLCNADRTGGELEHRVGGETRGEPPRSDPAAGFFHFQVAVEVNEVDGKLHKEGVHCFARLNPQRLPWPESLTPQQALPPPGATIRHFRSISQLSLARNIEDLQANFGFWLFGPGDAVQDGG